jgi:uncharacterized protein
MAEGLPDRVDCAYLADHAVVLERIYPLGELPRLQDLLAEERGCLRAKFAFARFGGGRAGASVVVEAAPHLVCQRCLQGFEFAAAGGSEIEFSSEPGLGAPESERELFAMEDGLISLRELAEEELLLALPIVALCGAERSCGRDPGYDTGEAPSQPAEVRTRPFAGLQNLLKKT